MGAARPWKRLLSGLARAGEQASRPTIEVEVERWRDAPLLRLSGELDHHAADGLRASVQKVLESESPASGDGHARGPAGLVLDMDRLSYIDSGGLALLFDIARTFEEQGQGQFLGILSPSANVKRLLEISGLHGLPAIRMISEEDEALLGAGQSDPGPEGVV